MTRRKRQSGSVILEMTFVGIPLIFMLISIFEISRGMWIYHTLSFGAREATRFMVVHGANCQALPNKCGVTPSPTANSTGVCGYAVLDLATEISCATTGLEPNHVTVTFTSGSDYFKCLLSDLKSGGCPGSTSSANGFLGQTNFAAWLAWLQAGGTGTQPSGGSSCTTATYIPTCGGNFLNAPIVISLSFPFSSAISMFWPGATSQQFGTAILGATSTDLVQF